MKKSLVIKIIVLSALAAASLSFVYFQKVKINKTNNVVATTTTAEGDNTKVYPILNIPMEKSNMIWCGTFQLAWNELRDNIIKEDIKLKDENKFSPELNKKTFAKDSLNEKDYIAMIGYKKDNIVEKINKTLSEKFNEGGKWKVESKLTMPDDILAYSFLKKELEFENAFDDIKEGLDFNGTKVKAFGITESTDPIIKGYLEQQATILNYKSDDEFIISLSGKNKDDEIILAKIPEKDTLENTLNYALANSNEDIALNEMDTLKIPMLDFDIEKEFKDIEGKSVENKGFDGYSIGSAIQRIEFSLTEKGSKLESKAEITMMMKGIPNKEDPKNLIFDKPFLLYMKEKGEKKPYFAMWVDNSDIMTK